MKIWVVLPALTMPIAGTAQAAERPCLASAEAEALATVALPDIIRQAGTVCAPQLPATSLLRRPSSPLLQRYDAEADRAWPAARASIIKLSNPAANALLQSDYARPLLTSLVAPLIVGRIAVKDCSMIDRLVTLLEPLPPRNTAGVIVTFLQYLRTAKPPAGGTNPVAALPLCAGGGR